MSQTPDIVERLRSTYAEPVVLGSGIIAPKRKSTCAVTQVYRNPDGPDGAATIEDLQNTIARLTRELGEARDAEAAMRRIIYAYVDPCDVRQDDEAFVLSIARHEHRKD